MARRILPAFLVTLAACGGAGSVDGGGAGEITAEARAREVAAELGPAETPSAPDALFELRLPEVVEVGPQVEVKETVQPSACGPACPPGMCDEEKALCLLCDEESGCPIPNHWCREGKCVQTTCIPTSVMCQGTTTALTCSDDGESWVEEVCAEGLACGAGKCQEVICTPGDSHCDKGALVKCDPAGVGWMKVPCPPGYGCFKEQCELIRHNLLVIFDTSGSMASAGTLDQIPCICGSQSQCKTKPFPQCEDPDCPVSKLGLAKHVFNKFFQSAKIGNVHIVLTHFPQRVKHPPVLDCANLFAFGRGWYGFGMTDSDFITGDDDSHVTADGGWFDTYLYEILSVPFPTSWAEENLEQLKLWVNFNEEVAPTVKPCATKNDCPGGFCAPDPDSGQSVCWFHSDPELRALTGTPLGRSLFYAGELYRKQMMPNGKSCTTDADCANRNYFCSKEGECRDPFAHCRGNMVLMFTDGEESPATDPGSFFNPLVQAKRLRYGLGCAADADCAAPAKCQSGICSGYPQPNGGGGWVPNNTELPSRLLDYNDQPLQVTTHVIDLFGASGSSANRAVADHGGGTYYHADLDPDELLEVMVKLLDMKQNLQDCIPEFDE